MRLDRPPIRRQRRILRLVLPFVEPRFEPGLVSRARHGRAARRFQSRGRRLSLGARLPQLPRDDLRPLYVARTECDFRDEHPLRHAQKSRSAQQMGPDAGQPLPRHDAPARYGSPKREPTPPPTPKPICATSARASPTAGRKSPPCPASTASSGTTGSTTATRGRCASACAAIPTTPKTPAARNQSGRPTATRAPTARRRPSRLSSPSSASPTGTFCNPSQTETDEKRHRGVRAISNAPMPFPARRTDYRSAAAVSATGYSHRQDRWRRTRC